MIGVRRSPNHHRAPLCATLGELGKRRIPDVIGGRRSPNHHRAPLCATLGELGKRRIPDVIDKKHLWRGIQ